MNIELKLGVTSSETTQEINLSEYGMTKDQWLEMDEREQENWLYDNVINEFDPPAWALESIEEL